MSQNQNQTNLKFKETNKVRVLKSRIFKNPNNLKKSKTNNNLKFSGVDLSKADFSSASLYGVNLEGANLFKTNLEGANLKAANMKNCNMLGTDFSSTKLNNVDWGKNNKVINEIEVTEKGGIKQYLIDVKISSKSSKKGQ